jgi:hypothetical protein
LEVLKRKGLGDFRHQGYLFVLIAGGGFEHPAIIALPNFLFGSGPFYSEFDPVFNKF